MLHDLLRLRVTWGRRSNVIERAGGNAEMRSPGNEKQRGAVVEWRDCLFVIVFPGPEA
jgi:hypothetical protein